MKFMYFVIKYRNFNERLSLEFHIGFDVINRRVSLD